jgi:hypothetical protein
MAMSEHSAIGSFLSCVALTFFSCTATTSISWAQDSDGGHPAKSLTAQAGDPTAPLLQLQVTDAFTFSSYNGDGYSNLFNFQPVIPVGKTGLIPTSQILRFTVPVMTTADPGRKTGLGDITFVNLFVADPAKWGIWGLGYSAVAPTASSDALGQGKWQLGPAVTLMYYGVHDWQLGGLVQNPVSIAGDGDRPDVNTFEFQPIANYLKGDWYFGAGDFNWTYDWKAREWAIPLAFQFGQVRQIGKHKFNISFEVEWTAVHPEEAVYPRWGIRLGLVLLLPE